MGGRSGRSAVEKLQQRSDRVSRVVAHALVAGWDRGHVPLDRAAGAQHGSDAPPTPDRGFRRLAERSAVVDRRNQLRARGNWHRAVHDRPRRIHGRPGVAGHRRHRHAPLPPMEGGERVPAQGPGAGEPPGRRRPPIAPLRPGSAIRVRPSALRGDLLPAGGHQQDSAGADCVLGVVPSLGGGVAAAVLARRSKAPFGIIFQDLMGQAAAQSGLPGGGRASATCPVS